MALLINVVAFSPQQQQHFSFIRMEMDVGECPFNLNSLQLTPPGKECVHFPHDKPGARPLPPPHHTTPPKHGTVSIHSRPPHLQVY